MLESIVFSVLNGLLYGMLLFMLASGLTLIFGMMGVLNFAHASFYMLGAYCAYSISQVLGFWPALILAPLFVGLLGALTERFGLRNVHKHGHVAELLFTFGLVYVIDELVILLWGQIAVPYGIPPSLDFTLFTLFGSHFPAYRGFILLVAIAMFAAIYVLLVRTRVGMIIRASLSHPEMVGALGHDVPRIFTFVFAFGTGLAGLAGAMAGNYYITEPGMAFSMGPIVFVVVVFGGLGSLGGALAASLIIGLVTTFAVSMNYSVADMLNSAGLVIGPDSMFGGLLNINFARLGQMLPYLMMVLILIFRPRGLMGDRES
ncbi:branched-chain amino acid ABC transporter permease [Salinisphaera aquimarina]|uniref:Branched-chain amino acid ABC transporter permease n=1 Tax=Salinisphaera aquimarina TaxID=2094031 RepID=A0ABV7ETG3_9GAMM